MDPPSAYAGDGPAVLQVADVKLLRGKRKLHPEAHRLMGGERGAQPGIQLLPGGDRRVAGPARGERRQRPQEHDRPVQEPPPRGPDAAQWYSRSEEHTSELQ